MKKPLLRKITSVDFGNLSGELNQKKVVPSNLDGITERKGYFLVIETKIEGESLPKGGQEIMLKELSKLSKFTVVVVTLSGDKYPSGAYVFDPTKIYQIKPKRNTKQESIDLSNFNIKYKNWEKRVIEYAKNKKICKSCGNELREDIF